MAGQSNYAIAFNLAANLDFFLAAMFLWTTPLEAAISNDLTTDVYKALASSLFLASTAASNFFIAVLKAD